QPVAPGGTDDIASLWINPAPSTFGGFDPAGAFTNSAGDDIPTNSGTNNHTLQSFILRQNGTATDNRIPPGIIYDELRVGTNWADVTPAAVVTGVPGDYNGNGVVDAADYVLWRSGGPLQNEIDAPGTVNAADYTAWRSKFGNTSGAGAGVGSGSVVPEPATLGLFLMSAIAFFSRRSVSSRAA
ncbi:MAG TPA: PEP-CTERM sorting domain-containing protein, partial [Lacipirellulaceae bacterium]|nr:PEP-CTERM sorting domain-containing protein [Lacipirellulaceae bacterium]